MGTALRRLRWHPRRVMAEQHKPCNGTGETQTVNAATGDVQSNTCQPCGGNGTVASPQHGGNNQG